jgi:metallo-beta-lactamase family protein
MTGPSLTFLGAAGRVTGSCTLVEWGEQRVLIDFGMIQGESDAEELNRRLPQIDFGALHALVLTHGHLDHSGRAPLLAPAGFAGPILGHTATLEIAELVWRDAVRLSGQKSEEALYTDDEVGRARALMRPLRYGERADIGELSLTLFDAGHILGSSHVLLERQGRRLLFSGDVGVMNTPIIRDPTLAWDAPVEAVVIESTYGDRRHRGREETVEEFAAIIEEAVRRRGMVLIPAFAIGRTQEIVFHLRSLMERGRIPEVPVLLDSPMGERATDIYRRHGECYDPETREMIRDGRLPLTFPALRRIANADQSRAIRDQRPPAIVIAGSGMCSGGRILHHLRNFLGRDNTTVVFVGFQGQGTLGRRLVDGEKSISIHGEPVEVKARIATLNGFSAHADQPALVEWARRIPGPPAKWLVNHGEPAAAEGLRQALAQAGLGGAEAVVEGKVYGI